MIRSNEDIQLLPAYERTRSTWSFNRIRKLTLRNISSGETMEIVPPASVADKVISLAKKTKFSDMQGHTWKSNPFLATNSESVDAVTTYVDQFEVKNEFMDGDAAIEPLVEPSNFVRSRNEFIEIPAEALHIAKEAAKSSMISVPAEVVRNNSDRVQPNTDFESPVVELEGDEVFFPGTVMDPETNAGMLKLAPLKIRKSSVNWRFIRRRKSLLSNWKNRFKIQIKSNRMLNSTKRWRSPHRRPPFCRWFPTNRIRPSFSNPA